jgi:hypothetical protein
MPTTTIATPTMFVMHQRGADVAKSWSFEVEVCDENGGFFHIKNLGNSAGIEIQLHELEDLLHHCKAFAAQYTANTGVSFGTPEDK